MDRQEEDRAVGAELEQPGAQQRSAGEVEGPAGVLPGELQDAGVGGLEGVERLDRQTRRRERVMLGLRLDEPLPLSGLEAAIDRDALARLERLGLATRSGANRHQTLTLTDHGRFLGGGVTAELLA